MFTTIAVGCVFVIGFFLGRVVSDGPCRNCECEECQTALDPDFE